MTSLTVSSCVRIVGMTEPTGSCLLLKLLIVPLYEGSRAQATVKGKFFATHSDVAQHELKSLQSSIYR
jgi:hypothetical protein